MRLWLVDMRKEKKLSQTKIAGLVGIGQQTYSMIERRERNPSVKVAKKIAEVLDFDWTTFYKDQTA